MLPKLDYYIVLTKYDEEKIKQEYGIKVLTIHNPVSFISEETSKLTNKQFLAAGRFTYTKGFDMLIESFKIFSKFNKDWKLVIVGEGKEKKQLQNQIKNYNLQDRIRIDSFTDDIKKYFLNSSTLLLSSRWEGMPMIVLESIEMGVPVIAYNIIAMQEIFEDAQAKILVSQYDINEYANAMLKVANDDEYRKKLGKNAKERSRLFSKELILKQWEDLLKSI